MNKPPDTIPIRKGEELDVANLSAYIKAKLPHSQLTKIEQFPHGHSNLVYLIQLNSNDYVLRRPPLGPVPPKAHDMAREFRVLEAVHPHFPEAPQVVLLCEDLSVIGAPFFLMERRRGIVLRDAAPPEWNTVPNFPRRVSEAFVDCLARLHAIDVRTGKLSELGKPAGFTERQVRGWSERWHNSKTQELPEMNRIIQWLHNRLPPSPANPATLVHNDFKLENLMLRPPADRVEAVLDWEMATLGDPLADLGLALCYWLRTSALTTAPQWFTRDEIVQRYAQITGRDMTHLRYHEVLGIFKLAVILQQIYARYHRGQTQDPRFQHFDRRVSHLAGAAAELVERQP